MYRDSDRHKLFTRRMAMLAGGKVFLLSLLSARLAYLQIVEADKYATLAEENRINFRLLPPPRGRIVDRFGVPMAENKENHRVLVVREQAPDINKTLDVLGQIIPLTNGERRRILRDLKHKRSFVPVTVRENLDWEEVSQIEVNSPDLPGVVIDIGQTRYYPYHDKTAHVLGYVAAVSEDETGGDPLLELPGFRIGKAGIEKVHDLPLRGAAGSSQVEVNAYGRIIREISRKEGQLGAEVSLTIDMGLQDMIAQRLGDESAAAVVMDVHTGDVLALASTPSYDSNSFNRGLSSAEWKSLVNNERSPLTNKSIRGQYAPGSTFKMCVALAALEKGVIDPESHIFCSGKVQLGNAKFHCWKKHGHGPVNMTTAIQQSCDTYFYEIAKRTGIDRIAAMARKLGLGSTLGLDLPGEQPGLVPSKDWKLATKGVPWQKGETLIAGIGQGFILTTPLQLAVMTSRLVNGGVAVKPRLTRGVEGMVENEEATAPAEFESLGLPAHHLQIVRDAMDAVVNSPRGTARRSKIDEPGMEMGGKTGTVQVRRISKAERETRVLKNEELPWKERDHALFVGYAPVEAPVYAVAVVVEHGGGGSKAAAPIARDILIEAQNRQSARPGKPINPAEVSQMTAPTAKGES